MGKTFKSVNLKDTKKIAKYVKQIITDNVVICLRGDLGAGKTTFTKELLKLLGVKEVVSSPTFTIVKQYNVKNKLYSHLDLYRLNSEEEMIELGFDELVGNSDLTIIEWPLIAKDYLNRKVLLITIKLVGAERVFEIEEVYGKDIDN